MHADSLVGQPNRGYYNASFGMSADDYVIFGNMEEDREFVQLRTAAKRLISSSTPPSSPNPRSVSDGTMSVTGLRIDTMDQIGSRSVDGVITAEALKIPGWIRHEQDGDIIPDQLWRTMVADRGPEGVSAPRWYLRACQHALALRSVLGDIHTVQLIDQGRDSIVVEFLKRVRGVVWNRKFFRSLGSSRIKARLGLAPPSAGTPAFPDCKRERSRRLTDYYTLEFPTFLASSTNLEKFVSSGISSFGFWQALSFEIQEMPTREETLVASNVKSPPTEVSEVVEFAKPEDCIVLPAAAVPV
jgi:hypothetical protein